MLATANPVEYEGTYPLPEAQLDRFMVRLAVGYPSGDGEAEVLTRRLQRRREEASVEQVVDAQTVLAMQAGVETVAVDPDVVRYCVDLAAATRELTSVEVGASPRGSQALLLVAARRGGARRPLLRHPRGRQGDRRPRARPPPHPDARRLGVRCAARSRWSPTMLDEVAGPATVGSR